MSPKIHAFAVIGGTMLTLIMAGSWSFSALPAVYAMAVIAAAGLMTMCFLGGWRLIPAINHARDQGNLDQFNRLHRFDVMLMLAGMLLALIVVIALVYVLPGQFTFSPTIAPTTSPSVLPMTA